MHVLHILEATRGGTRRHILDLLPALQARGIQCTLVASPLRNPGFAADAAGLRECGIEVIEIPMARGMDAAGDAAALKSLGALLKERRFDLIHCHSTKAGLLGRFARLLHARETPLVYTPHCIAFDTGLPHAQRRAARFIEKLLACATTHYIAVSQHERRAILSRGLCGPGRVSTIYNGLDVEAFDALPSRTRAEFGLRADEFVIGCFGRLTRQKNQSALLRAFPLVQKQASAARILLVGGGEDEPALRSLAGRLGIDRHIVWAGEQHEARPLYALCDVIAQPSRWEGCPYSLLEAMAAQRAVVAHATGGVEEILNDDYGLAYRTFEGHGDALAHNILKMAGLTPESALWSESRRQAARLRVERVFTLERMVAETVKVYDDLLTGT